MPGKKICIINNKYEKNRTEQKECSGIKIGEHASKFEKQHNLPTNAKEHRSNLAEKKLYQIALLNTAMSANLWSPVQGVSRRHNSGNGEGGRASGVANEYTFLRRRATASALSFR